MRKPGADPLAEKKWSLWLMVISPTIWSVHFLLCYITAAIWCAKYAGPDRSLGIVRPAIGLYTLVAVIGICITGYIGYRQHAYGSGSLPHDADSAEDRHRFLGFSTLLLSALSLVGTLFAAMVTIFFWRCD